MFFPLLWWQHVKHSLNLLTSKAGNLLSTFLPWCGFLWRAWEVVISLRGFSKNICRANEHLICGDILGFLLPCGQLLARREVMPFWDYGIWLHSPLWSGVMERTWYTTKYSINKSYIRTCVRRLHKLYIWLVPVFKQCLEEYASSLSTADLLSLCLFHFQANPSPWL